MQRHLGLNLNEMGVDRTIYRFGGTTTFVGRGGSGAGGSGEGNAIFISRTRISGGAKWPTLVIEVGLSESLAGLRQDM